MIRNLLSIRLGEKRMSQTKLSKLSGVRQQYISDMYNEMSDNISLDKLDRICQVLECDVGDLLKVETEEIRKKLAKPGKADR